MLRLTHGIARNHQVMNRSVFGRTEERVSHDSERERGGEREIKLRQRQRTASHWSGVH